MLFYTYKAFTTANIHNLDNDIVGNHKFISTGSREVVFFAIESSVVRIAKNQTFSFANRFGTRPFSPNASAKRQKKIKINILLFALMGLLPRSNL